MWTAQTHVLHETIYFFKSFQQLSLLSHDIDNLLILLFMDFLLSLDDFNDFLRLFSPPLPFLRHTHLQFVKWIQQFLSFLVSFQLHHVCFYSVTKNFWFVTAKHIKPWIIIRTKQKKYLMRKKVFLFTYFDHCRINKTLGFKTLMKNPINHCVSYNSSWIWVCMCNFFFFFQRRYIFMLTV